MSVRSVWLLLLLLPCCLLLAQCGMVRKARQLGKDDAPAPPPHDPMRRGWGLMMSDEEFARFKQGSGSAPVPGAAGGAAPGDSGDGGAFDFSGMLQGHGVAPTSSVWQRSATAAAKQARTTVRPMLIYVTHKSSVPSQQMERTLMAMPDFQTLMESFVPLMVDFSDQETSRSDLYRELKSRLDVRGYPSLIVTLPDGTEVMHLSGYNSKNQGIAKSYLESLQASLTRSDKRSAERRTRLEKEDGYRIWKNKDGKPVFAKLTALDANMATFSTEWGESFKTFLTRLSDEDQAWIAERRK